MTLPELIKKLRELEKSIDDAHDIYFHSSTTKMYTDVWNGEGCHEIDDVEYDPCLGVIFNTYRKATPNGKCCVSKGNGKEEECCEDDAEG